MTAGRFSSACVYGDWPVQPWVVGGRPSANLRPKETTLLE